ncbi:hypothetical protein LOK49_LG10G02666, partial [Camellia lanceoleosa]
LFLGLLACLGGTSSSLLYISVLYFQTQIPHKSVCLYLSDLYSPPSRWRTTPLAGKQTISEARAITQKPIHPYVGVGFPVLFCRARVSLRTHGFNLSLETSTWFEQEDRVSSHVLLKVIANACKVPTTFVSELTESEDPDECVKHFDEDQELEQLISGEICFKVYPFSSETNTSNTERKIMLSGSFNPLHEGHLKLLEVATRYINLFVDT